jgi:hypothetical protein
MDEFSLAIEKTIAVYWPVVAARNDIESRIRSEVRATNPST